MGNNTGFTVKLRALEQDLIICPLLNYRAIWGETWWNSGWLKDVALLMVGVRQPVIGVLRTPELNEFRYHLIWGVGVGISYSGNT